MTTLPEPGSAGRSILLSTVAWHPVHAQDGGPIRSQDSLQSIGFAWQLILQISLYEHRYKLD